MKYKYHQFHHSVVSGSLRPHGLQHARLPFHHQLLELIQTHVHQVSDAIQLSYPTYLNCHPLLLLLSIFFRIRFFFFLINESVFHTRWTNVTYRWKCMTGNIKDKKRDKRGRDGDPSREGSLKKEVSKHQETL